jgi:predicted transcriptional regulator
MNITQNELLEAIRAAMETAPDGTEGFTVGEIAEAIGRPHETARNVIKGMLKNGTAEVVKIRRTRMDGAPTTVSGYRLKKA